MNFTDSIDFYQAEVAYRREKMRRDREPFRFWHRSRKSQAAPGNRKG